MLGHASTGCRQTVSTGKPRSQPPVGTQPGGRHHTSLVAAPQVPSDITSLSCQYPASVMVITDNPSRPALTLVVDVRPARDHTN